MQPDDSAHRRTISKVLADLRERTATERVSVRDIVDVLGDRGLDLAILVWALPNAVGLGVIPGISAIFGLPQFFVAVQMLWGVDCLWLPVRFLSRSIAGADLRRVIDAAAPRLTRIEHILRPRWLFLSSTAAERVLGLVIAVLAAVQILPIPLSNLPPAVAAALLAIGLIARDGVFVLLGLVIAVGSIALTTALILGGAEALRAIASYLFGG